jgi:hypothetical protein
MVSLARRLWSSGRHRAASGDVYQRREEPIDAWRTTTVSQHDPSCLGGRRAGRSQLCPRDQCGVRAMRAATRAWRQPGPQRRRPGAQRQLPPRRACHHRLRALQFRCQRHVPRRRLPLALHLATADNRNDLSREVRRRRKDRELGLAGLTQLQGCPVAYDARGRRSGRSRVTKADPSDGLGAVRPFATVLTGPPGRDPSRN